jgi:hypothetical protein
MMLEPVPPMSDPDVTTLANRLARELTPTPADPRSVVTRVVSRIGGFAWHVHHVFDRLDQLDRPATEADVDVAIDALACGDGDPADLGYSIQRIERYYESGDIPIALSVLDAIAGREEAVPLTEVVNLVRHALPSADEAHVKATCTLLRQDHYLTLRRDGHESRLEFRWALIEQWWRENRL